MWCYHNNSANLSLPYLCLSLKKEGFSEISHYIMALGKAEIKLSRTESHD